jgi:hypothetical protein
LLGVVFTFFLGYFAEFHKPLKLKKKKNPINQNYPSIFILIPKMKSFSKSSFSLFLSFQEKLLLLKSNGRIYSTLLLNNKINKLCGKKEDFVNYDAIL